MSTIVASASLVRITRAAAAAVGLAVLAMSGIIIASLGEAETTYAAMSPVAAVAMLGAGFGLVAGGLAWLGRPGGWPPLVATVAGVAWLAPVWVGWHGGPAAVRSLGMVMAPFLLPALVHLLVAYPSAQLAPAPRRLTVAVAYAVTAIVSVGRALVRDPILDRHCWSNCSDNIFLVTTNMPLARVLDGSWRWLSLAVGVAVAVVAGWRLARANRVGRAVWWVVLAPLALAGAAEAAYAAVLLRDPAEAPTRDLFMGIFLVRAAALVLLAFGLTWAGLRAWRQRLAVGRLAEELGAAPPLGSLQAALARSLGDETVTVAYRLPGSQRYVDTAGRPVDPQPGPGQAPTSIVRGGQAVAVVCHDRDLRAGPDLAEQIGSAARLAIDNERLRAAVLAQLEDLRASRARIVEAGDAARRRLERDLHDGAQQRLLAVMYELRLAHAEATSAGDVDRATLLDRAVDDLTAGLAELRELAHGIFPAVLAEAGLESAWWSLANRAAIPVTIDDVPPERLPPGVEQAAYLLAASVIERAAHDGSTGVALSAVRHADRLVINVGGAPEGAYPHLDDRVGALGGHLTSGSRRIRAEIPCG